MATIEETQEACIATGREVVAFLHNGGLEEVSVIPLNDMLEESSEMAPQESLQKCQKVQECLQLCQELGFSMAYLDHQDLLNHLVKAWELICALLFALKKQAARKLKLIEADPKSEDEVKQKYEDIKNNLEQECAVANITLTKIKLMAQAEDI
mmetsp:Transcript_22917/g.29928  ORF Transcript_22917/g.29928 Transcript_22917/m.29928 type:complete len:153 (-) Transcript_22917:71-529(-)